MHQPMEQDGGGCSVPALTNGQDAPRVAVDDDGSGGARLGRVALVPAVEGREVACVPRLAQPRRAEVPVRTDFAGDRAQVVPQIDERGPAPDPVAVIDAED
jgi:hypothetical protein